MPAHDHDAGAERAPVGTGGGRDLDDGHARRSHAALTTRRCRAHVAGGARELTVTGDYAGPLAIIPPPDDGRPTMGTLNDLLAVLGYTRASPWSPTAPALVADCEPIRPGVS